MKKFLSVMLSAAALGVTGANLPEVNPQKAWRPVRSAKAQKAVEAKPRILNSTTIVCGNKKLVVLPDGKISISNSSGEISQLSVFYVFKEKDSGKIDWIPFSPKLCKIRRDGSRIICELWKKNRLHTWKLADQVLEVQPDGLIKVNVKMHMPQTDKLIPRSKNGAVFIQMPLAGNDGKKFVFNGKNMVFKEKMKSVSAWRGKYDFDLFPDSPAENIILRCVDIKDCSLFVANKKYRITYTLKPEDKSGSYLIDLRKSAEEKLDAANTRIGVDFKRIENLELPWVGKRNTVLNSSFEQGFHSWKVVNGHEGPFWKGKWEFVPFELSKNAYHGKYSLLFRGRGGKASDYRQLRSAVNLTSGVIFTAAGKYTISFYAKTLSGKGRINVWMHNFHTRSVSSYLPPHESCKMSVYPGRQWKRFSRVVTIPKAAPTAISFNVAGESEILIDAIQVEPGSKASAFEFPAIAGTLITSDPDNFINSGSKINARARLFGKAGAKGELTFRVKNFFGEIIRSGKQTFKIGKNGHAFIALPFENVGNGVFEVRFDYKLADGRKSFDLTRFAVVDFLDNTHRLKDLFSFDYGPTEIRHSFFKYLDRYRKLGAGAKPHVKSRLLEVSEKYKEYGIRPLNYGMAIMKSGKGRYDGFDIVVNHDSGYSVPEPENILIKDHNRENNGVLDEDYLKRFSAAVEKAARSNKHIKMWVLAGEFRAKFDNFWWSKDGTAEGASHAHGKYLKAFVDGVRRGNPDALVFQDDPCNMAPQGGIAETAQLLEVCNKYGVRFDFLAIHPYRFSPESPDLDADAQTFFKTIKKYGYGDDVKVMWPEMMHWGPYNIPQWGTISSTWGGTPRTWRGWPLTYGFGATEKLSAAWYARSWLVALKYSDRIINATAGSANNNFCLDEYLTPYAAALIPNTLGNLLGDSRFKKDIRFAPFIRAYVFEDAQKRPVAAVWCHMEKVDNGYTDAPVAEADFGNCLESVIDLMNSKRSFTKGKFKFPVSSYPLFLRGKKGTLDQMIKALEKAMVISGEGISPVEVSINPADSKTAKVSFRNFLSGEFKGKFNGKNIRIPGSGKSSINMPLPAEISGKRIVKIPFTGELKSAAGQSYTYDLGFTALTARKIDDKSTFRTVDWSKLPKVKFPGNLHKKETSGVFSVGWNRYGLFIQAEIKDRNFNHIEYPKISDRWRNDCLQIYFDTFANARSRQFRGYDEDDYDYAIYPNSKGNSSIVFRQRSVEQQLGLATAAPKDMTVADDIPSSFSSRNGILTYRVFFPAKYLLPAKMTPGWVMGLGIYAGNSDKPGVVSSALTIASDGKGCYNRPHAYPALLLVE